MPTEFDTYIKRYYCHRNIRRLSDNIARNVEGLHQRFCKISPSWIHWKKALEKVSDVMFTKKLPLINYNNKLMKSIDVMSKYNHGVVIAVDDKKCSGNIHGWRLTKNIEKNPNISNILLKTVMTKKS